MRAPTSLLALASALVLCAPAAEAGIVVLKNGEVFVGKIKPEEDTQDELVIRWPYEKDPLQTERGEMKIPKFRIRWYDREADEPTDEYWTKHESDEIDNRWMPFLERWRIRKRAEQELPEVPIFDGFDSPQGKLAPVPVTTKDFVVRKPEGWSSATEDGITIFVSDRPGADGFRPRIHVFSGPVLGGGLLAEQKIELIKGEFSRLAQDGKFEVREMKRLRNVRGGSDQEMLTATPRAGRSVLSLRQVSFRDKRTYFFEAFADERDYGQLEILFKACMRSLQIGEDAEQKPAAPGGSTATPPPATPPAAGTGAAPPG